MANRSKDVTAGQGDGFADSDAASLADGHPGSSTAVERTNPSEILSVLEETLNLSKRQTKTGSVRISTRTETYEDVAEVALEHGVVDVIRVPMDRIVDVAPQVRTEGETTIVPVVEERLVVSKQLVLVEELHIRRRVEHEIVRTPVALRRQHVEVEHLNADGHPVT